MGYKLAIEIDDDAYQFSKVEYIITEQGCKSKAECSINSFTIYSVNNNIDSTLQRLVYDKHTWNSGKFQAS